MVSHRIRLRLYAATAVGLLAMLGWPAVVASQGLRISPPGIHLGLFFRGTELTVSAEVPEQAQIVIEVIGDGGKEELMRKGKHWDLWMNVEEIDVYGVPYVYHIMGSSTGLDLQGENSHPWGYSDLFKKLRFGKHAASRGKAELFREFVALKQSKDLYRTYSKTIESQPGRNHRRLVKGGFQFPSRLPAGTYTVRLWTLINGAIVGQQTAHFDVSLTGIPAVIVRLASARPGLYGGIATLVAAAAGLLCGFVFKKNEPSPVQKDQSP